MRRGLNFLYTSAAILAALFLIALLLTVLLTILARQFNWGLSGIDGYAGYFLAGSGFLAMAHTFQKNEHIRVTVFLGMARGKSKFWIELWALGLSSLLAILLAFFSVRLVVQSFLFKDISTSMDATPLWIPQLAMAIGTVIFAVSVIDRMVCHLRQRTVPALEQEALRHE